MAIGRLLWRMDADTTDFDRAAEQAARSTRKISDESAGIADGIDRGVAALGAMTAAMTAVVDRWEELRDLQDEVRQGVVDTTGAAALLGEDRAAALAVEALGQPLGIGAEQYFDAAEAVLDQLRVEIAERPDERIKRAAAEGIGLDVAEFTAPGLSSFERSNLLLDALASFEGDDAARLQAASELGAGDVRDFALLAGVVSSAPDLHPRRIAETLRQAGVGLSAEQVTAATVQQVRDSVETTVGEELLAGAGPVEQLRASLPGNRQSRTRQIAREVLGYGGNLGWENITPLHPVAAVARALGYGGDEAPEIFEAGYRPPVRVVVTDSTVGGIRAAQHVADADADGRVVTSATEQPARR